MSVKFVDKDLKPIRDHILVEQMYFGDRKTAKGIIIPGDDGDIRGIRPRWAKVYSVGHEQQDITPGEYVLVEHGRWTRGVDIVGHDGEIRTVRRVDPENILLVSSTPMQDENVSYTK